MFIFGYFEPTNFLSSLINPRLIGLIVSKSCIFHSHHNGITTTHAIKTSYENAEIFQKNSNKNLPKNGRRKATHTVEITSTLLKRMKHQGLLAYAPGRSSSKLLANGLSSKEYLFVIKEEATKDMMQNKGCHYYLTWFRYKSFLINKIMCSDVRDSLVISVFGLH